MTVTGFSGIRLVVQAMGMNEIVEGYLGNLELQICFAAGYLRYVLYRKDGDLKQEAMIEIKVLEIISIRMTNLLIVSCWSVEHQ